MPLSLLQLKNEQYDPKYESSYTDSALKGRNIGGKKS